jgi:hypothetical protein
LDDEGRIKLKAPFGYSKPKIGIDSLRVVMKNAGRGYLTNSAQKLSPWFLLFRRIFEGSGANSEVVL